MKQNNKLNNYEICPLYSTLLELGASPNYRDARGLTPLYLSVIKKTDAKICESLLHDHATLGTQDSQGWQEVHQVNLLFSFHSGRFFSSFLSFDVSFYLSSVLKFLFCYYWTAVVVVVASLDSFTSQDRHIMCVRHIIIRNIIERGS